MTPLSRTEKSEIYTDILLLANSQGLNQSRSNFVTRNADSNSTAIYVLLEPDRDEYTMSLLSHVLG